MQLSICVNTKRFCLKKSAKDGQYTSAFSNMNTLQPSSNKRRRSESTQSCESGVSVLSGFEQQSAYTIEIQEEDEISETSKLSACTTESFKTSPNSKTHDRKMKANAIQDSKPIKTKRKQSIVVSCSCCDEEAQTLVKEIESWQITNGEQKFSDRQCNRSFTSVSTSTCRCNCQQEDQKEDIQKIASANQFARNIVIGTQTSRPGFERSRDHECGRTNEIIRCGHKSPSAQLHGCDSSSLFSCHHSSPHLYESLPQLPINAVHRQIPEQLNQTTNTEMETSSRYQRRSKSCDYLREEEIGFTPSLNSKNNVNQRSPEPLSDEYFEHRNMDCTLGDRKIKIGECIQEKITNNWLYILLILNIVIIGFNVENFLRSKEQHEDESAFCMQCADLKHILGNDFKKYQLQINGKEECCTNSLSQLLSLISNIANSSRTPQAQAKADVAKCYEGIPIVQYKAIYKTLFEDKTRISWEIDPDRPVQRGFEQLDTHTAKTTIVIPQSGIYYVYLRIHHKRSGSQSHKPFDIGYSILKNNDVTIDSFDQNCTPSNSSSSHMDHTNHLASLQNLTSGDKLYVILTNPDLFEISNTKLGLILVS